MNVLASWPCGPQPNTSNLNYVAGATIPNTVLATVGMAVCLDTSASVHLIVDVFGYVPRT